MRAGKAFCGLRSGGGTRFVWWAAASLSLHGLALLWTLSLGGAERIPAASNLRVRLVEAESGESATRPALEVPRPAHILSPHPARKAVRPSSPSRQQTAAESFPALPAPAPLSVRQIARPPVVSASPSGPASDGGVSKATAGPVGEGVARSLPSAGAHSSPAEFTSPGTDAEPPTPPANLEAAARGLFLMPDGIGGGTGRADTGAAGQGSGSGGGGASIAGTSRAGTSQAGAGGTGTGKTGQGGSGRVGGGGVGLATRGGPGGPGGGEGIADLLRRIRQKIEQAKAYPDAARQEGIQGTVELRFRIAPDGSVEAMEILRSSGSGILDEASEQTIRRAAPYPVVRGWVRLPLSYRLDQ